jgi:nucleoside transporter
MNDSSEESARLAAIAPETPLETPLVPIGPPPSVVQEGGAELASLVAFKLAGTLFLHHVCIGSWFVTLGNYVSANSGNRGLGMFSAGFVGVVYGAGPLGAMISPFVTGWLADRHFPAERIVAVLNILCAAALCGAVSATSQGLFYLAVFAYFLCFHPSASLATSMALHHLRRPERDFAVVRAGGTAGWIAAGVLVGWLWPTLTEHVIESTATPMKIGVAASIVNALFSLTLPHTPPANGRSRAADPSEFPRIDLWHLLRDGRFAALMILAVSAHIPSQFYYAYSNVYLNWTGMSAAAAKMTLGQVVEVGVMLALPALLVRLSVKAAIIIGLGIWALRFLMLAAAAEPSAVGRDALLYAAILLHGVAFTMVTISLQLDVDRCAGRHRRSTAQGLFSVAVQGFGCFVGSQLAGRAGAHFLPIDVQGASTGGWQMFWLLPAVGAATAMGVAVLLLPGERD